MKNYKIVVICKPYFDIIQAIDEDGNILAQDKVTFNLDFIKREEIINKLRQKVENESNTDTK
jgi:hypothetical protein